MLWMGLLKRSWHSQLPLSRHWVLRNDNAESEQIQSNGHRSDLARDHLTQSLASFRTFSAEKPSAKKCTRGQQRTTIFQSGDLAWSQNVTFIYQILECRDAGRTHDSCVATPERATPGRHLVRNRCVVHLVANLTLCLLSWWSRCCDACVITYSKYRYIHIYMYSAFM